MAYVPIPIDDDDDDGGAGDDGDDKAVHEECHKERGRLSNIVFYNTLLDSSPI
jgi:hypothetical protein